MEIQLSPDWWWQPVHYGDGKATGYHTSFVLMSSSYGSLLKIIRKEVYVPKWLLDIHDESKNYESRFLIPTAGDGGKKNSHLSSSPVWQLHFVLCNFWNIGLEILDLLSLVPKYSGLTIFKQNHNCFLWQVWTFQLAIKLMREIVL